jgi:hypothetical protein
VDAAGEDLERASGIAANGDGVAKEFQDGLALGEGLGAPDGFGVETGEGDEAERNGLGSGYPAEVRNGDCALD